MGLLPTTPVLLLPHILSRSVHVFRLFDCLVPYSGHVSIQTDADNFVHMSANGFAHPFHRVW